VADNAVLHTLHRRVSLAAFGHYLNPKRMGKGDGLN
jgi:hypothetical protein